MDRIHLFGTCILAATGMLRGVLIGGAAYFGPGLPSLEILAKFLIVTTLVFVIRVLAIWFSFHLPVASTAPPVDDHPSMGQK